MSSVHKQSPGTDCTHTHTHTTLSVILSKIYRQTHTYINHLAQLNMKNPFRSVVIYAVSGFRSRSSSINVDIVVLWADFLSIFVLFFCDLLKGNQELINISSMIWHFWVQLSRSLSLSLFLSLSVFFSFFECTRICAMLRHFSHLYKNSSNKMSNISPGNSCWAKNSLNCQWNVKILIKIHK